MKKLTTNEIVTYLQDGATLSKVYGVYKYWVLTLKDGKIITNLRKGSPDAAKEAVKKLNGYELFNLNKTGFSIRVNN